MHKYIRRIGKRSERGAVWVAPLITWLIRLGVAAGTVYFFTADDSSIVGGVRSKLGETFQPLFDGVMELAEKYREEFTQTLMKALPERWVPSFNELMQYIGFVDYFLCLQFAVVLIFLRYAIIGVVGLIRFAKSFLPWISG